MPPRSPAGASHSIHHEVNNRSLCALIHHNVRDRVMRRPSVGTLPWRFAAWGYLKEFRFSGRCQSAGSSRKSWSVPGSPPFLLKQRGEAKQKPSRSSENRTTTKKAPGPETQRQQPPGPNRTPQNVSFSFGDAIQRRLQRNSKRPRFGFVTLVWLLIWSFSFPPEALESIHRDATADGSTVYVVTSQDGWN